MPGLGAPPSPAEALKAVGNVMEDGNVTKLEAAECRKQIMDLMQICMGLLKRLDVVERS